MLFLETGLINVVIMIENRAEINYHRKHTTYVEITIPKKEIEFHFLKKDLEDKSTNR